MCIPWMLIDRGVLHVFTLASYAPDLCLLWMLNRTYRDKEGVIYDGFLRPWFAPTLNAE